MYLNNKLLEASDIAKHFMTDRERKTKKALCQLLVSKGHRKYAERFWKFDFNIVDSKKNPEFTAAISFDEATVFISDGFLGSSPAVFNQLDVLLRHELAHNLMMHQIRLMYVFKKIHADDPDRAYEHISYSGSLHDLLNIIEDFEISNKRYTAADKQIVETMQLNGEIIGGLVTEDHRASWKNLPLEKMYNELTTELNDVNTAIRSNPMWRPTRDDDYTKVDMIKGRAVAALAQYNQDIYKPSIFGSNIDTFMKSQAYTLIAKVYKELIDTIVKELKPLAENSSEELLNIIKDISKTGLNDTFKLCHPKTGEVIYTLYTPEDKQIASDVIKTLLHDYILGMIAAEMAIKQGIVDQNAIAQIVDAVKNATGVADLFDIIKKASNEITD